MVACLVDADCTLSQSETQVNWLQVEAEEQEQTSDVSYFNIQVTFLY